MLRKNAITYRIITRGCYAVLGGGNTIPISMAGI